MVLAVTCGWWSGRSRGIARLVDFHFHCGQRHSVCCFQAVPVIFSVRLQPLEQSSVRISLTVPEKCFCGPSFTNSISRKPSWWAYGRSGRHITSLGTAKARGRSESGRQGIRLCISSRGPLVEAWWHEALRPAIATLTRRRSCGEASWRGGEWCTELRGRSRLYRWWNGLVTPVGRSKSDRSGGRLSHAPKHWAAEGNGGGSGLDTVGFSLSGKHSFRLVTVSLTLSVLLVRVLDRDLLVHEVLAVHVGNGIIGRFKVGERNEPIALGQVRFVAGHLGEERGG
jgi:hypothetical protein